MTCSWPRPRPRSRSLAYAVDRALGYGPDLVERSVQRPGKGMSIWFNRVVGKVFTKQWLIEV